MKLRTRKWFIKGECNFTHFFQLNHPFQMLQLFFYHSLKLCSIQFAIGHYEFGVLLNWSFLARFLIYFK